MLSSPAMPGGLGRSGGMINDPDLAEAMAAHNDLIERGIIADRVDMQPIRAGALGAIVQVYQLGVLGDDPIIRPGRIVALHQVIPCMPFPNDIGGGRAGRGQFYELLAPHYSPNQRRIPARGNGLRVCFLLPGNSKYMPVGHRTYIVVLAL